MTQSSTGQHCNHCGGKVVAIRETLHGPPEYQCLACSRPYLGKVPTAAMVATAELPARAKNGAGETRGDRHPGVHQPPDRAASKRTGAPVETIGPLAETIAAPGETVQAAPAAPRGRGRGSPVLQARRAYYETNRAEISADYREIGASKTCAKWEIPAGSWRKLAIRWELVQVRRRAPIKATAENAARRHNRARPPEIPEIMAGIKAELKLARRAHPAFNSAHEGYAVILEELDELKAEVWRRDKDPAAMRREAYQVAAMAARFVYDVTGK